MALHPDEAPPPVKGLRVAAAQASSAPGDAAANAATAARLAREAEDAGARLVVLPEAFLTGYVADPAGPAVTLAEDDLGGDLLAPLRSAAPDLAVVVGTAWRHADGRRTLALLVVRDGHARHAYDKHHLDADEVAAWHAGPAEPVLLDVDGRAVGLAICSDASHPGHALTAARAGAEAYAVSAAWFSGREDARDRTYADRARESGIPVVAACSVGPADGGRDTIGGSRVVDGWGRLLAEARVSDPGVAVAVLSPLGRPARGTSTTGPPPELS